MKLNYPYIFAAMLVMAGVTYLVRMLPLLIFRRKITNRFVNSFLFYAPFAVLTAMTIPDIFTSTANIYSAVAGLIVALFLAYKKRGLLTVASGAVIVVFLVELLMNLK